MAEDGQAEGRLGDEDVAGDGLEGRAGRIGAAFIVARDDDLLARMFEHDLGGAEDVASGDEADIHLAHANRLAIVDRRPVLLPVADVHDRQRLRRREHPVMAAPGMIGMAMGDERQRLRPRGIDPGIGRLHVNAFGERLHPGTETGHVTYMAVTPQGSQTLPERIAQMCAHHYTSACDRVCRAARNALSQIRRSWSGRPSDPALPRPLCIPA